MADPRDHPCGICGATPAMRGFYDPLHRAKGILWACDAHVAAAEDRWRAATQDRIGGVR